MKRDEQMPTSLPIKRLVSLDLSGDGRAFLITAEMQDGEKAEFAISFKNGDWLAQNMLRFSRAAMDRQAASGEIQSTGNHLDTLVVEDHQVSIKPNTPQVLAMLLGHWESSEDARGAIALLLDRQKATDLATALLEVAEILPQISRPS